MQAIGRQSQRAPSVADAHPDPHRVVHGALLYALADTGMGAALYPALAEGEIRATIEIKINYFRPVTGGEVVCTTPSSAAAAASPISESKLCVGDKLVAQANGNYAILVPRGA